jgi:hypothetical protein
MGPFEREEILDEVSPWSHGVLADDVYVEQGLPYAAAMMTFIDGSM